LAPQLRIATVVSEMFAENAFVLHLDERRECVVVDPGLDVEQILDLLETQQLSLQGILNTHGHADHIAGNAGLKQKWPDAPLLIGAGDANKLTDPVENLSAGYGLPLTSPSADQVVREGDVIALAGMSFEVLETPGHSCGHVVFVNKQVEPCVVLGGDVLFQGSIGRTDFPDGSYEVLLKSIHDKLFPLPDETIVLPGHGPATTIGQEKKFNPFVGE